MAKSVTLGLLINEKLKSIFYFLNDPELPRHTVNITCERCDMPDCKERVSEPKIIAYNNKQVNIMGELDKVFNSDIE